MSLEPPFELRPCGILGPSWSQDGFPDFVMSFYQQNNLKPITSDSLHIYAYKYYITTERQSVRDTSDFSAFSLTTILVIFGQNCCFAAENRPLLRDVFVFDLDRAPEILIST